MSHNFLRTTENIQHLAECPSISILDLSHNKLEDPDIVDIFEQMPNLAVLNLMSNPVTSKIPNYRRTLIARCKNLTYLDDRPVFDNERLATEAWVRGGVEAEREERQRQRAEENERQNKNFEALRKLQADARARRLEATGQEDFAYTFANPALEKFRDDMLTKISETNPAETHDEELTEIITEGAAAANAASAAEQMDDKPPIRTFTRLSISGRKIAVGDEDGSDSDSDDGDEDEGPEDNIKRDTSAREESVEPFATTASRPLIQDISDAPAAHDLPPLEDASSEIDLLKQLRKEAHTQQSNMHASDTPNAAKSRGPKRVSFKTRDLLDEIYEESLNGVNPHSSKHEEDPTQDRGAEPRESMLGKPGRTAWDNMIQEIREGAGSGGAAHGDDGDEDEPAFYPPPKGKEAGVLKSDGKGPGLFNSPRVDEAVQASRLAGGGGGSGGRTSGMLASRKLMEEVEAGIAQEMEDLAAVDEVGSGGRRMIIELDEDEEDANSQGERVASVTNAW
ncbi:hypothetical protein HK104_010621 [Borealophlyctis nickersoniae]|nr:hypothetical protein HK104_010621 [Borealophlyctis nickersoniae]